MFYTWGHQGSERLCLSCEYISKARDQIQIFLTLEPVILTPAIFFWLYPLKNHDTVMFLSGKFIFLPPSVQCVPCHGELFFQKISRDEGCVMS